MIIGNLEILDLPYIEANKEFLGEDFAKDGKYYNNEKYTVINTVTLNTDQELHKYLSKAREAVRSIETGNNGGRFDYDICIAEKCWGGNSNTVQHVIYKTMGLPIKIPEGMSMPGINGKFYDGPLDDYPRKYIETIERGN